MKKKILIAPSLLSADFTRLGEEVKAVEAAGADWLHVDVMDGHFVPNITIGPVVVKAIKKVAKIPLDVHLMIEDPLKYIKDFALSGSGIITFHIEACKSPGKVIESIRSFGKKVGVSVKPKTPVSKIKDILKDVDMVLVMSVEPGFGGQSFMEAALPKIEELRSYYDGDIEVDGGISSENSSRVIKAGANILVAGTGVFKEKDYTKAIKELREER